MLCVVRLLAIASNLILLLSCYIFLYCKQINATSQALDDSGSSSPLLAETSSLITEQQQQNVNKKMKNNKNWTVYIVTSIVQTLEDVCVNIVTKPQNVEVR